MPLLRFGGTDEAKATLDKLRELCKQEQLTLDMDIQGPLSEAEKLIAGEKQ